MESRASTEIEALAQSLANLLEDLSRCPRPECLDAVVGQRVVHGYESPHLLEGQFARLAAEAGVAGHDALDGARIEDPDIADECEPCDLIIYRRELRFMPTATKVMRAHVGLSSSKAGSQEELKVTARQLSALTRPYAINIAHGRPCYRGVYRWRR